MVDNDRVLVLFLNCSRDHHLDRAANIYAWPAAARGSQHSDHDYFTYYCFVVRLNQLAVGYFFPLNILVYIRAILLSFFPIMIRCNFLGTEIIGFNVKSKSYKSKFIVLDEIVYESHFGRSWSTGHCLGRRLSASPAETREAAGGFTNSSINNCARINSFYLSNWQVVKNNYVFPFLNSNFNP